MPSRRTFLWFWIGGLVLFAAIILIGMPLKPGITAHQAAGTAENVTKIHCAWFKARHLDRAKIAMLGDLLFIGVYGVGCVLGGLWFRRGGTVWLERLGTIALAGGLVFLLTDYTETISQIIQLFRFKGDDGLAGLAATMKPIKEAAWVLATLAILAALFLERRSRPAT